VAALNPALLVLVGPALAAAAVVATGFALLSVYWRQSQEGEAQAVKFRNPFGFWSVVGFALLLGAIIVIGRLLGEHLGTTGAVVGAAALGLADVDAVTVSMARLAPQPLDPHSASYAILAAVVSNTASKLAIGAVIGRGRFAAEVAMMSLASMLVGGMAFWLAIGVAG
jgi:uncharacterized membrane protein (DUF4010 family)